MQHGGKRSQDKNWLKFTFKNNQTQQQAVSLSRQLKITLNHWWEFLKDKQVWGSEHQHLSCTEKCCINMVVCFVGLQIVVVYSCLLTSGQHCSNNTQQVAHSLVNTCWLLYAVPVIYFSSFNPIVTFVVVVVVVGVVVVVVGVVVVVVVVVLQ